MPIYFNVPTLIFGGRSYNSGVIHRRARTAGFGHREAPMEVSSGIMRDIGVCNLGVGIEDDFTVLANNYYSGHYISGRKKKTDISKYSMLTLDLYTVNARSDLSSRSDAVLIRACDQKRVEILSGGGYSREGERLYDNIFLRVKPPVIVVIQRLRDYGVLLPIDYYYIVTDQGVREIMPHRGDDASDLANLPAKIEGNWIYV